MDVLFPLTHWKPELDYDVISYSISFFSTLFYVKNQFWPSYNHFLLSPKIDSPLLTTCIRSDDVIEKWPMQANLF